MAKTTRKTKNAAAAATTLTFDMTTSVAIEHSPEIVLPPSELESIFADLNSDEIVEHASGDDAEKHPTEFELRAAVGDATHEEALKEVYAEQEAPAAVSASDAPSAESTAVPKKEKKAKAPKDPRLTYVIAKKSEIVAARVPTGIVLEVGDADLSAEDLTIKQAAFLESIDALPKKVGEKAVQFFSDVQKYTSVGDIKNEVIRRAIGLLLKDGELTSGDKGNLQADLMSKPYSLGTSRSQSNQMFALLPALKITLREKGRMIANPDSVLLMMLKGA